MAKVQNDRLKTLNGDLKTLNGDALKIIKKKKDTIKGNILRERTKVSILTSKCEKALASEEKAIAEKKVIARGSTRMKRKLDTTRAENSRLKKMRKVRYRGKPAVYVNQTKFKNRKNQGVYT
jgi:hypothetical protein